MAFSLRWPVFCVWLHTDPPTHGRNSSLGLGFVCLNSDGARPFAGNRHRRCGRAASRVADGRLEDKALDSSKDDDDAMAAQLNAFSYSGSCKDGSLVSVEVLKPKHSKGTVEVLTDSFCDLLWGPLTYRPLLRMIVQENLIETQKLFPKNVILVALYEQSSAKVVVGTVEVYLSSAGVSSPNPPPDAPFLCNMAVKQNYRRKGIAGQLLKAAEELAVTMGSNEMYLHCRLIDKVPLGIYQRAGYEVVSTSSVFSLLVLQRRKHLMRKRL
ncbi:uncharacterized protein LOC9647651 [Selaginella moellendorffii]|nr:uncharacterized protein LOC9647651 [Selaginella moellendorffii]|eukprot:XP_002990214.2 uncharacterized protein LOC9647651 [Selaginella moellendorffii]